MEASMTAAEVRQKILLIKDIPPLPLTAQKILCMSPDAEVAELAETIEQAPFLAARLLGLANSAFFGWPGGVRTLYDAIYKVLGIKLVKSLAVAMSMSDVFDSGKCRGFQAERYWFTAVATAQISQGLFLGIARNMRGDLDNIHMHGLLHNLGIVALAHLFPHELSRAFTRPAEDDGIDITKRIRSTLGVDHSQAGGWLGRKWRLPEDIICVMEQHKDPGYRGDYWPFVALVGYSERQARSLFMDGKFNREPETEALLGLTDHILERVCNKIDHQMEDLNSMVSLMAKGE
jgi:HD-like signal output (HDOD) protein